MLPKAQIACSLTLSFGDNIRSLNNGTAPDSITYRVCSEEPLTEASKNKRAENLVRIQKDQRLNTFQKTRRLRRC